MGAKKAKAKPRPKPTAAKGKPKAKAKAKTKAKIKTKAKASKPAPRAKAKPKQPTAKAKPAKPMKRVQPAAPSALPPPEPIAPDDLPAGETATLETKKGPLARLAGGVGNLFARMTGKKAPEAEETAAPDETPMRSPDQTIELASGDILAVTEAPPPTPKSKS